MRRCRVCRGDSLVSLLDLGPQPLCNRYLARPDEEADCHPLGIGQCDACGVVQLLDPAPAGLLVSPFDWITYNEAEGHLDHLTDVLCRLPGLPASARVCGVSYKDDTTVERLKRRGYADAWRIDPAELGVTDRRAGIETLQAKLTPAAARRLAEKHGPADLLLVRHIFEHAHDPRGFAGALGTLVRPGGYLVFEVPDCARALDGLDYTTLWEEHVLYLTPDTFRQALACCGLSVSHFELYPYTNENSLVAVAQVRPSARAAALPGDVLDAERQRARAFAAGFDGRSRQWQRHCSEFRRRVGKIALFGAGHLAATFLCVMGLQDDIAFVVDDHPHKRGMFMPGSRLPIKGSAALLEENVRLCLTSLSPESEAKVIQKNQAFVQRGGVFASIFPASKSALQLGGPAACCA